MNEEPEELNKELEPNKKLKQAEKYGKILGRTPEKVLPHLQYILKYSKQLRAGILYYIEEVNRTCWPEDYPTEFVLKIREEREGKDIVANQSYNEARERYQRKKYEALGIKDQGENKERDNSPSGR